ncbi:hypothetical protein [Pseudohoeflea coraliihabitans]|uniref:hypothetical protein n=1 Tax=Pseudohoeflea coraliihabitans TaxID=2860393 RepID=UPI0032048D7A
MATPQAAQRSRHALHQAIASLDKAAAATLVVPPKTPHILRESAFLTVAFTPEVPHSLPVGDAGFAAAPDPAADQLPLGVAPFDAALGGGLPRAGLIEIRCEQTRDWGLVSAFAAMLIARFSEAPAKPRPLVWISAPQTLREGGDLWLPGLLDLLAIGPGTPAPQLLVIHPRTELEALWAAETAATACQSLSTSSAPTTSSSPRQSDEKQPPQKDNAIILVEIRGNPTRLGLSESRRLHFRARSSRQPLLLLRQAADAEASAAPVRFCIGPAPAALRHLGSEGPRTGHPLAGSLGAPALQVTLEKSRASARLSLILEWLSHDHRFQIRPTRTAEDTRSGGALTAAGGNPADSRSRFSRSSDRQDLAPAPGTLLAFDRAS